MPSQPEHAARPRGSGPTSAPAHRGVERVDGRGPAIPFRPASTHGATCAGGEPSTDLPEASSPKAARILAATAELLVGRGARGFTVADVAQQAHVGKGTVYLYWASKEDLLVGLIVRDFLALADELVAALGADHGFARPSRLGPLMFRASNAHPFVSALQSHDGLLGMLAADARATRLLDTLGPSSVLLDMIPVWREHGLVRTDWAVADQGHALHAVMTGFITIGNESRCAATDPAATLAAVVAALVETGHATEAGLEGAAAALVALLERARHAAFAIIGRPAAATSR